MARRKLRLMLCAILAVVVFLFLVWPTVSALLLRRELAYALQRAHAVRLEEHEGSQVLSSVELPRSEWREVIRSFPIVPDVGVPLLVKLCFIPHHRIVVIPEQGEQFIFRVCFDCEQVATESSGILSTPYLWRSSVHRLFTEHQIPIRDLQEYHKLAIQRLSTRSSELPSADVAGSRSP
jgi:hypothetical protein